MINEYEKEIVRKLQEGLPLCNRPFRELAKQLGIEEEKLIYKVKEMLNKGIIRRLGAVVNHLDVGYVANAMIVWDVPDEKVQEVGLKLAGMDIVSHCYQRPRQPDWPYNLFTVVHCKDTRECQEYADALSRTVGVDRYSVIISKAELKKSNIRYFI